MHLPQFPETNIEIILYQNVSNASDIRSSIAELPYAFIDACTICSVEQLMSAIYRVLIESKYNRLRTKSLHSEVLLALSPTSNIGEAFKRFGISDKTKNLIMVEISQSDSNCSLDKTVVTGDIVDFKDENLQKNSDLDAIRKIYKIDQSVKFEDISELSRATVNAIQLRGL
ncbi:similar to Saccharomyces cerevisiae YML036W CGI121 Component of the EKC/KEOPS complex with Bud32p, Kae1p, Pcc1p, and Gon7p [Maudiozyma barnettii]|uniref:EKC/KEOPS complex subunit CGI121 n=1 Tax=Maudiozyma barnettii TaxID=61262 RepID=A0A8H2VIM4_9SACH|nr:Cgi121p [Kazachstania barnettii]CAB4256324.1 similar to Saccharomyces cerevisiae YML036W CGI121 Component of the EKC/KEOPS complex with Bud32p, Kae1p, Pcc1p, and Gon7p [Kazachstania barnettii]CAD1784933.1 similar to Saccharomyces cerevisiae YML036W CGI121 Component of the EKC/KEOPS complex with Bud32p, Kae1p, Pcc1p, and Gon7p [Kazachstania barnettii]